LLTGKRVTFCLARPYSFSNPDRESGKEKLPMSPHSTIPAPPEEIASRIAELSALHDLGVLREYRAQKLPTCEALTLPYPSDGCSRQCMLPPGFEAHTEHSGMHVVYEDGRAFHFGPKMIAPKKSLRQEVVLFVRQTRWLLALSGMVVAFALSACSAQETKEGNTCQTPAGTSALPHCELGTACNMPMSPSTGVEGTCVQDDDAAQ
jgi:hypothetical protein